MGSAISLLSLTHSLISIVAVTVHFFISLLFPVNCSDLNPLSSPFVAPILLSSPPQGRGRGKEGRRKGGREVVKSL